MASASGALSAQEQLVAAINQQTAGHPRLQAAMLTGAFYESGFYPGAAEPDPTTGQPAAESYGAYSMRTSGVPGVVGGVLDTLIKQGFTPQQAVQIAQNPVESTTVMLPYYQAGVQQANWNAGIAEGAAQAAAIAERPAQPYGTTQAQDLGQPLSQIVSRNFTEYIIPAESGNVTLAPPLGQTTPVAPGSSATPGPPPNAVTQQPTVNLTGFGALLQQLDAILNPAQQNTGGGIGSFLANLFGGVPGGAIYGAGSVTGSLETIGLRLLFALPGVIGLLMAAAGGILGALVGGHAKQVLQVLPAGDAAAAAAKVG